MGAPDVPPRTTIDVAGEPLVVHRRGTGRDAVLFVHGLLADHREILPAIDAAAARGLTAIAPDLRGCGASGGARGHTSPARALEDLTATGAWIGGRGLRLAGSVGHSLGGAYLLYAAAHGFDPGRLVVAAVPASVRGEVGFAEYVGYRAGDAVNRAWRALGRSELRVPYRVGLDDTINDPACRAEAARHHALQPMLPLSNVRPLLSVDAVAWARHVSAPTLVLLAEGDRVVRPDATRAVHAALVGPKRLHIVAGGHSMFWDAHRDEAVGAALDWIEAPDGPVQGPGQKG